MVQYGITNYNEIIFKRKGENSTFTDKNIGIFRKE